MSAQRFAGVAIEKTAFHFDRLFDYIIPDGMNAKPGCRVLVSFGAGKGRRQGIIYSVSDTCELDESKVKPLVSLLDDEPVLNREMLMLAGWISESCFCTLYEAARLLLPVGINLKVVKSYCPTASAAFDKTEALTESENLVLRLALKKGTVSENELTDADCADAVSSLCKKGLLERCDNAVRNVGDAKERSIRLSDSFEPENMGSLSVKQHDAAELLMAIGSAGVREVCDLLGVTKAVLDNLVKKGAAEYFDREIYRRPKVQPVYADVKEINLTDEQQKAYENMRARYRSGEFSTTLLYGVTGSGKTSVYMKLIDDVVADGRSVIVLVPEISLTPMTLDRFRARYGDMIAVLHSGLSLGQRLDEWKRVRNGDAKIVIGTRSAIFAPFSDIGLIVIDEEQEYTYKSESAPRYHARDAARFRCAYHKCPLLLCSATPSVESYYHAFCEKKYELEILKGRYGDAVLPEVDIVDISSMKFSDGMIGGKLGEALKFNLENGYQSIILHNRRGYNTFVSCRACGHVLTCESCSVSMTYHHDTNRLVCHYCSASVPFTTVCPKCGEAQLRYAGHGTQKAEDELERIFPDARILRMDADSTVGKSAYTEKLAAFSRGDYDIMVGTQMVAKGLDFKKVTLVGVLFADQTLCCDDFRSSERAFSLLTQVVGRSGRGEFRGKAIIQTISPDNDIISLASTQDYDSFFSSEIKMRKAMLYPPFSDICMVGFVGSEENAVRAASLDFMAALKEKCGKNYGDVPIRAMGPAPAAVSKVMNRYRYRIIIKCRSGKRFRELMRTLLCEIGSRREYTNVTVFADMNPENVM